MQLIFQKVCDVGLRHRNVPCHPQFRLRVATERLVEPENDCRAASTIQRMTIVFTTLDSLEENVWRAFNNERRLGLRKWVRLNIRRNVAN